jgi:hypothetical protein
MRVPLLLVANPRHVLSGPTVFLRTGKWRIIEEGITTTEFVVLSSTPPDFDNTISGPCNVHIEIKNPGDETSISIYAELI